MAWNLTREPTELCSTLRADWKVKWQSCSSLWREQVCIHLQTIIQPLWMSLPYCQS